MTPSIGEILAALREEGSIEGAARRLGVSRGRMRLYAYTLAGQGLLKLSRPKESCNCGSCPLRGLCGITPPRRSR
ncbi:MAG: hypothetical protein F7C34_04810 [Desulfurococcales archaeon]|nr:hypothetical protein [Desulfurococcales archaeon]